MITQETVLILGAGASMAYGFPSGSTLKALIWKQISHYNDIPIAMGINTHNPAEVEDFKNFTREFKDNLSLSPDYSIDSFLEHHNDKYRKLGKICIAAVLSPFERRRYLFDEWMLSLTENDLKLTIRYKDGHWYQYLFNQMCKDCKFEDFTSNNLSIVTFNYDRSLEYYLLNCLHAKYKKDFTECANVLNNIPILHIYGKLGNLPELSLGNSIKYDISKEISANHLMIAEKSIKIIHDANTNTTPEFQQAQELVKKAKRIYFLGFGYLEENMRRLFTDYSLPNPQEFNLLKGTDGRIGIGSKCFGTMLDISPHYKIRLTEKGLKNLEYDISYRPSGPHSGNFPNTTIYNFLFYNENTRLV